MTTPSDNRAVSALVRVFGGAGERVVADAEVRTGWWGMHRGEMRAISVLIPLTVLVATGDWLFHSVGPVSGILLAAPLAFLALNVLPFVLAGKNQVLQWQLWLIACVAWAIYHRGSPGVVVISSRTAMLPPRRL